MSAVNICVRVCSIICLARYNEDKVKQAMNGQVAAMTGFGRLFIGSVDLLNPMSNSHRT